MTNQDWTPPEVVFVERDVVKALASPLSAGAAKGFVFTYDNVLFNGHPYTLTSTVEEAKRKAVRSVYSAMQEYVDLLTEELNDTASIAAAHGWRTARLEQGVVLRSKIEKLLTQYPQPTEASDEE